MSSSSDLLQREIEERERIAREKKEAKEREKRKKEKQQKVGLYVFLGIFGAVVLGIILYFALRDQWSYGCLGPGQCVAQRGNLSKQECEQLCRQSDPADDMWVCTPQGCRMAVGEERLEAISLAACENICRRQFEIKLVSPIVRFLGGSTPYVEGECGRTPNRVRAVKEVEDSVVVAFPDLSLRTDPSRDRATYTSLIQDVVSERYLSIVGSNLVWTDDRNQAISVIFSPVPGTNRAVYELESSSEFGEVRELAVEQVTGCPDDLVVWGPVGDNQRYQWEIIQF